MESKSRHSEPGWRPSAIVVAAITALSLAACGQQDDFANNPRPPAPINVSAYVSEQSITVSPDSFGGGPIVVTVTNQSEESQETIVESDGSSRLKQSSGPINPGDTGQIKVLVKQGTYTLRTASGTVEPATMTVGEQRESAQNRVLQP